MSSESSWSPGNAPSPISVIATGICAFRANFVSSSEADHIADVLRRVADKPVLTVSDIDGFAARGGILNFVLRDKKIRFVINVQAADRAGLKLSSRLLKLAEIVTTVSADEDRGDRSTGGEE